MKIKPGRSLIYVLLFTGCSVNYMDRIVLSVAAQPIAHEFALSTVQLGYLFSAFLWSYLFLVLPWGAVVDRIGTRRAAATGMAAFSAATFFTGLSGGFVGLILSRLAMGAGEASTYPVAACAIREWMPARERGLATAVFNCGVYAGPAFSSVTMGFLVEKLGWRGSFFVAAALGFAWVAIWLLLFRQPEEARFIDADERATILRERGGSAQTGNGDTLLALLRCKTLWGLFIVQGCAVYTVYLFLSWVPSYLQAAHGLNVSQSGIYTAIPYAAAIPGTIFVGWLSDRLLRRVPVSSGRRRNLMAIMLFCSACILAIPLVNNIAVIITLLAIALTCIGSAIGLNMALASDLLLNPASTGKAQGVLVTGGNLFGVIAPIATGYVVSMTGNYDVAFFIAGALLLIGLTVGLTMTRKPIVPKENRSTSDDSISNVIET